MSIPASHIKFSDDRKTAWVVFDDDDNERLARSSRAFVSDLDRPCDRCHGKLEYRTSDNWRSDVLPCDCRFGQHCFDIEVVTKAGGRFTPRTEYETLTVSVVPGMVAPIVDDLGPIVDRSVHVRLTGGGIAWLATPRLDGWRMLPIDLPDVAATGMYAVRLNVHTPDERLRPVGARRVREGGRR